MTTRKALGKGLSALLPDVPDEKQADIPEAVNFISVDLISPNPFQPREKFDEDKLEELARSIAEKGVVQPITVRRRANGYQIIAGERRLRSVQMLGLDEIPAFILQVDSDEEMMELSIIENIHREDLNPIDVANGYRRLIEECHLTQEQVAHKVCKDRATVANFLRLLKLPRRIQQSAQSNEISMGHARALLSIENAEDQLEIWNKTVKNKWSVRQVEKAVKKLNNKEQSSNIPKPPPPFIEDAENKLRTHLATKVAIKSKQKGGMIEISYYNDQELERLLSILLSSD